MANTFVKIASVTVTGATAASIDFSSIPSTYTDLCLKFSTRVNNAVNVVDDVYLSLNNVQTNFSMRRLFGNGSSTASDSGGGNFNYIAQVPNASATASTFGNSEIYIPNYASSGYKSISADSVSENNATAAYAFFGALLWSNSAAINRITITGLSSSFVQYSTATLFGIKNS
jgi:hypothetical protein